MIDSKILMTKYRSLLLNIGILVVAFIIGRSIYSFQNNKINELRRTKDTEIRKNEILSEIDRAEKKIAAYEKLLSKKEASDLVNTITQIARDSKVRILSIRPGGEKKDENLSILTIDVNINASDYHSVGEFISRLEACPEAYTINSFFIKAQEIKTDDQKVKADRLLVQATVSAIMVQ